MLFWGFCHFGRQFRGPDFLFFGWSIFLLLGRVDLTVSGDKALIIGPDLSRRKPCGCGKVANIEEKLRVCQTSFYELIRE